ncbi:MAG: hypothetical protein BZ151_12810 [Desulfobacca sp. 4484_104]|nr:MAG: hypothetical protein BZ151_12810 [Desulfobacca sp. 4484_104]
MVDFIIPSIMPNPPVSFGKNQTSRGTLRGRILAARKGRRRQRRYSISRYGGDERRKFREKRRNVSAAIDKQSIRILTLQVAADQDLDNLVGKDVVIRVIG